MAIRRTRTTSLDFEMVGDAAMDEMGMPLRARKPEAESDEEDEKSKAKTSTAEMVSELQAMRKTLEKMAKKLSIATEKTAIIELRQSNLQGEGTDAVRSLDQWARADSALLSNKAAEIMKARIQAKPHECIEACTYTSLFVSKDVRRGHYEIIMMYLGLVEQEYQFYNRGSEYEQGWAAMYMPELREILSSKGCTMPEMPRGLQVMLEMALPLGKDKFPFKWSEVHWMAPTSAIKKDLDEEQVTELARKLPEKVKELLAKMPKGEDESPSETLMHAAVYFNEFHQRWHESMAVIETEKAKKKPKNPEEKAKIMDENKRWAEQTELAMKAMLPKMGQAIDEAQKINEARAKLAAEKKAEKAKKREGSQAAEGAEGTEGEQSFEKVGDDMDVE